MSTFGGLRLMAAVCALAASSTITGACVVDAPNSASASRQRSDIRMQPEYDKSGRLRKLEYDRNGDGRPDAWGYMDGSRIVRVEVDENGDGAVDRWEYHDTSERTTSGFSPTSAADGHARGSLERIERATRLDGKVSRREFFSKGFLTKVEEDMDGDGRTDKWESYSNGSLSVMALDSAGRGTPDRRLVYAPDGSLDHVEADPSGSGVFKVVQP